MPTSNLNMHRDVPNDVRARDPYAGARILRQYARSQRARVGQTYDTQPHAHSVQFYHDDTFLTDSVISFIKEGLQLNDTVIIMATAQHREELLMALPRGEMVHDKLRFFDVSEQLGKFMFDDWPSEFGFRHVVGGMIAPACRQGRVRILDEMVAVLCAEGHTRAAIRLEELWNQLATEHPFSLLCAYPLSQFSGEKYIGSRLAISQLHTHVQSVHCEY